MDSSRTEASQGLASMTRRQFRSLLSGQRTPHPNKHIHYQANRSHSRITSYHVSVSLCISLHTVMYNNTCLPKQQASFQALYIFYNTFLLHGPLYVHVVVSISLVVHDDDDDNDVPTPSLTPKRTTKTICIIILPYIHHYTYRRHLSLYY